jgi:hypothetical protein
MKTVEPILDKSIPGVERMNRNVQRVREGVGLSGTCPLPSAAFHREHDKDPFIVKLYAKKSDRIGKRAIERALRRQHVADMLRAQRRQSPAWARVILTAVRALSDTRDFEVLTAWQFDLARKLGLPNDEYGVPVLTQEQKKRGERYVVALVERRIYQQLRIEHRRAKKTLRINPTVWHLLFSDNRFAWPLPL